ncbi:dCMP deaminase family protein [Candidatus Pacearchaeota archaeon]|nr:dCMP deaminase family protein [Candidatus Pacearchaeota archaeon]
MRTSTQSWDDIWMRMAQTIATRSKDPELQVGAVIVNKSNNRIATGFNGFPRGIKDTAERWSNECKKDLVIHAEDNALQNAHTDVLGWTLYVTLFPCIKCTNAIIHRGIKRIVYLNEPKKDSSWNKKTQAQELLKEAGIKLEKLQELTNSEIKSICYPKKRWWISFVTMLRNL